MAESNSTDEKIRRLLPDLNSKAEVIKCLKEWYAWGLNDKVGGQILARLGEMAGGDAECIAILEDRSKGQIYYTRTAALDALIKLARGGDSTAAEALERSEAYWKQSARTDRFSRVPRCFEEYRKWREGAEKTDPDAIPPD